MFFQKISKIGLVVFLWPQKQKFNFRMSRPFFSAGVSLCLLHIWRMASMPLMYIRCDLESGGLLLLSGVSRPLCPWGAKDQKWGQKISMFKFKIAILWTPKLEVCFELLALLYYYLVNRWSNMGDLLFSLLGHFLDFWQTSKNGEIWAKNRSHVRNAILWTPKLEVCFKLLALLYHYVVNGGSNMGDLHFFTPRSFPRFLADLQKWRIIDLKPKNP